MKVLFPVFIIFATAFQSVAFSQSSPSPICFTENLGQWDARVLFRTCTDGTTCWLTTDGLVYQLAGNPEYADQEHDANAHGGSAFPAKLETTLIRATFAGSSTDTDVEGRGLLPYHFNYFLGDDPSRWRTSVPNYESVVIRDIYPGIDICYHGEAEGLKYDLVLEPGADLSRIAIRYEGILSAYIAADGSLRVETALGSVVEGAPLAYQEQRGTRLPVDINYCMISENTVGFEATGYDPSMPLVIDPPIELVFSTYLDGSGDDRSTGVEVDLDGCAYITGATASVDFPTVDPFQGTYMGGTSDIFVSKFGPQGDQLLFSTYIGGEHWDVSTDLAIDPSGCIYILGRTTSSNFPTENAFQAQFNGGVGDAVVVKLFPAGDQLVFSTYFGGNSWEESSGIALGNDNSVYFSGSTYSEHFPIHGALQGQNAGGMDAFIARFDSSDSPDLIFSTYYGGSSAEYSRSLAVDDAGFCYVAGATLSTDFPVSNAFQDSFGGGTVDAFLVKLDPPGSQALFSTYLGGTLLDVVYGVDVGPDSRVTVTGSTQSPDFPVYQPFQQNLAGGDDAFVAQFSENGEQMVFGSFLGGQQNDAGQCICLDQIGNIYIAGSTESEDLPVLNPFQPANAGGTDAFVAKFGFVDSLFMDYCTYLGGLSYDRAMAVAVDELQCSYLSGETCSEDFPLLNPFQSGVLSSQSSFLSKFNSFGTAVEPGPPWEPCLISGMSLSSCPNPFGSFINITLESAQPGWIELSVYDTCGRIVSVIHSGALPSGVHHFRWDAEEYPAGLYMLELRPAGGDAVSQKVLLLR